MCDFDYLLRTSEIDNNLASAAADKSRCPSVEPRLYAGGGGGKKRPKNKDFAK